MINKKYKKNIKKILSVITIILLLINPLFVNSALATDYDGDGVDSSIDLDNDNDGVLDIDEGVQCNIAIHLDQYSTLPASAFVSGGGVVPDGSDGMRISDVTGNYVIDIYKGSQTTEPDFSFDIANGRVTNQSQGANVSHSEIVEVVFTTANSPTAIDLKKLNLNDIYSLAPADAYSTIDGYAWSESGT